MLAIIFRLVNRLGGFIINKMKKRIIEKLNGDLSDSLNLSIYVYTATYILSILSCVISNNTDSIIQISQLNDTLVPTTVTLVLSSVIQNIVNVARFKVTRFALSLWALLLAFAYMPLYFKIGIPFCLNLIFLSGLVILSMCSISQIESELESNIRYGNPSG